MFFLACAPPVLEAVVDRDRVPSDSDSSAVDSDTDDTNDTDDTGLTCPADMTPVGVVCIDRWENAVSGNLGGADQFLGGAPGEPMTRSETGQTPSLVTFSQAWVACEKAGKRLPESAEFEDAADGTLGPGGLAYPYGEVFDDAACVTTFADSTQQFDAIQPAGSRPQCESVFGAYDLVGNAWEWTVAPGRMEVPAWLADGSLREEEGFLVGSVDGLQPRGASIDPPELKVDSTGRLYVDAEQLDQRPAFGRRGYLGPAAPTRAEELLPFEVVQLDEEGPGYFRVLWEADGLPVPDKRGCAWYTGQPQTCTNDKGDIGGHFHDFEGTVGFRCVE